MASPNSRSPVAEPHSRPPAIMAAPIPLRTSADIYAANIAAIRRYQAGEPIPAIVGPAPRPPGPSRPAAKPIRNVHSRSNSKRNHH